MEISWETCSPWSSVSPSAVSILKVHPWASTRSCRLSARAWVSGAKEYDTQEYAIVSGSVVSGVSEVPALLASAGELVVSPLEPQAEKANMRDIARSSAMIFFTFIFSNPFFLFVNNTYPRIIALF